jgi:hypothetical protein
MNHGNYISHVSGDAINLLYQSHRGWLTAAVHTSIAWPEKDVMVQYDGDDYFLRGLKQENNVLGTPCISMRSSAAETNTTLNKLYRFSSILGWFMHGYVDVVGHITSSHPVLYTSGSPYFTSNMAGGPHGFNCNYMPLINNDSTRRALAFWREGLRLHNIHQSYSFLSFYKVIESQFEKSSTKSDWINQAIPELIDDAGIRVKELLAQSADVGNHIYKSGRCAIAHASFDDEEGDPDIPEDRIRISKDLVVIRALAQKYITEVLKVPDAMDVLITRNRLLSLHAYLSAAHIQELQNGGTVIRRKLGLNGLHIAINRWQESAAEPLQNLLLSVINARNGLVELQAINDTAKLSLAFVLDFTQGRAHIEIQDCEFLHPSFGGTLEGAIAVLEFQKVVIGNALIEATLPNGDKFDFEVIIPLNVDIGQTTRAIDVKIEVLKSQFNS